MSASRAETWKQHLPGLLCARPTHSLLDSDVATCEEGTMSLCSHCTDEETEAQRGAGAWAIGHSWH